METQPELRISLDEVVELEELLEQLLESGSSALSRLRESVWSLEMLPLSHLKARFEAMLSRSAAPALVQLHWEPGVGLEEARIPRELFPILNDVLIHLARNIASHAVEPNEVRKKAGKSELIQVRTTIQLQTSKLHIRVEDDGPGVDLKRLHQKAKDLGIPFSKENSFELLFHPQLSSAGKVTTIGGRGVGLSAVKERIEQEGGTCSAGPASGSGAGGFAILFTLPLRGIVLRVAALKSREGKFWRPCVDSIEQFKLFRRLDPAWRWTGPGWIQEAVQWASGEAMASQPEIASEEIPFEILIDDLMLEAFKRRGDQRPK